MKEIFKQKSNEGITFMKVSAIALIVVFASLVTSIMMIWIVEELMQLITTYSYTSISCFGGISLILMSFVIFKNLKAFVKFLIGFVFVCIALTAYTFIAILTLNHWVLGILANTILLFILNFIVIFIKKKMKENKGDSWIHMVEFLSFGCFLVFTLQLLYLLWPHLLSFLLYLFSLIKYLHSISFVKFLHS